MVTQQLFLVVAVAATAGGGSHRTNGGGGKPLNCTCPPNATTGAPVARKACGNAGHGAHNTYCPSNPAPHQCNPGGCNPPPPVVPEFEKLECLLHQLAFEFGTSRVRTSPQSLHDALMLGSGGNCSAFADTELNARILSARPPPRGELPSRGSGRTIYVATTGSDTTGTGSEAAPFASLHAAAAAIRSAPAAARPSAVLVREGKYYLETTLVLGAEDSHVHWAAHRGERVTLSGGKLLQQLDWKPLRPGSRIVRASVANISGLLSTAEAEYLKAAASSSSPLPPPPGAYHHEWGSPPARWNTLHVDGVRQVRARFPNGDPQRQSGICFSKANHPRLEGCPGYLAAQGQAGGSLPAGTAGASVTFGLDRGKSPTQGCKQCGTFGTFKYTIFDPPADHPVYNKPMPSLGWANNSLFSFWNSVFDRPAGVQYANVSNPVSQATVPTLKKAAGSVVHMFHGGLWGNWQYSVASQGSGSLHFGYGGYQEARGSGISKAKNNFYVENDLALLDQPSEWYHDPAAGELFFFPNGSGCRDYPAVEVVAPLLDTVVEIDGARNVTLSGFDFTETRSSFLEQYEVPSGGDWSIHRGATVFVQDSSGVNISGCVFNQTGGNAIFLSNNVTDSSITHSEFVHIGDSAIATVGKTDRIFGTAATYPDRILIANNHIREIGVYGKQTSCLFVAISANVKFLDNLCYNGPRAGLNWNDGFAGGSLIKGNLIFNMVRETGDHGPYNSWDRQPFLTNSGVDDGFTSAQKYGSSGSIIKQRDIITANFFINGYSGVWTPWTPWTIDHDDGSQFFNDSANVMAWGGCKNYLGHSKSCDHNVIIYPGIDQRAAGNMPCQVASGVFANQFHFDNHCFTTDGIFYNDGVQRSCTKGDISSHVYQTYGNKLYSGGNCPGGNFTAPAPCSGFPAWQAAGQDTGSALLPLPSAEEIVKIAKSVLDGPSSSA